MPVDMLPRPRLASRPRQVPHPDQAESRSIDLTAAVAIPAAAADLVAFERALVEEQLVTQAGAAAGLHGDPQGEVIATLLVEQVLDLAGRAVGEDHAGRRLGLAGVLNGHG